MDNNINNNINNSSNSSNSSNYNMFQIVPDEKANDFIMYGKYDNVNWENMNLEQLIKFRTFLCTGINNMNKRKNKNYGNN